MSIYVGGEKAKIYRGDYGPAQFYKGDVKIAGYTNGEKVGTQISGVETYNDALVLAIEGKSAQTVTANSPSPDHPEPIRSSENFDIVSCGKNLFDPNSAVEDPVGTTYEKYGNGFRVTSGPVAPCAITVKMTLSPHTSYSFSCIGKPTIGTTGGLIAVFVNGGWVLSSGAPARRITFSTAENGAVLLSFYSNTYPRGVEGDQATFEDIQLEFGTTSTHYEPYHATTAHVTDPLRSVGDVADSIEVSEGKVEVVRRVTVRKLTGDTSERWSQYGASIGKKYACMYGQLLIGKQLGPILFTHDMQVSSAVISGTKLGVWANTSTMWPEHVYWGIEYSLIGTNSISTVEENATALRLWLSNQANAGTPVVCQYQLTTPTRTDITATPLGQALLALRTQPHYTQVYTNATLPPTLRARIKEMVP